MALRSIQLLVDEKRLRIVEHLANPLEKSSTPSEIRQATGLASSSVFRFLNELVDEGLLESVDGRYRMSRLGVSVLDSLIRIGEQLQPLKTERILSEIRSHGVSPTKISKIRHILGGE